MKASNGRGAQRLSILHPEKPMLGAGERAAPLLSSMEGQKGQELPSILSSFHLSYLMTGQFPAL